VIPYALPGWLSRTAAHYFLPRALGSRESVRARRGR
jgi:hypothetical protein